jgi:hypothetical protein
MRISLSVLLAFLLSGLGTAWSGNPSPPEVRVLKASKSGLIDALISPARGASARMWRASSSWGAANWRVLVIRGSSVFLFRESPDQVFARNVPAYDNLESPTAVQLDLKSDLWIGPRDSPSIFQPGDRVVLVLDVPVTTEARELDVWYGTIFASVTID